MKNHFFCALGCAAALLAAGCASTSAEQSSQAQVSVKAIQSEDVAGVVISGKNVGDTILTALQKNDFSMAQKLPIGDGKNTFTQKKFNALYAKVKEQGGIDSFSYLGDLNMRPYHRLLWKVSFKDQPGKAGAGVDVLFEVVMVKLNGADRAAGFSFRQ